MTSIEIISHPLCPHAQRLVLIGLLAGKEPGPYYTLTYLPYATLPKMAPEVSPTGQLPVLRLDGEFVTASTDAAAEYLDSVLGLGLLPGEPAEKLRIRDGEKLASVALDRLRHVYIARDQAGLDAALSNFFDTLAPIEARLDGSADPAALNHFGYVALAPMGSLVNQFALIRDHERWADLPKLTRRLRAMGEHPMVTQARCPDYANEFEEFFKMTGSGFPALAEN